MPSDLNRMEQLELIEQIDYFDLNKGHHFRLAEIEPAIDFAYKIIGEAEKGDFQYIIKEQRKFIDKYGKKFYSKEKIDAVKTDSKEVKQKFDTLLAENETLEAQKIAQELIQKYEEYFQEFPEAFPDAKHVISSVKDLGKQKGGDLRKELEEIERLEEDLNENLKNNNLLTALGICEKILQIAESKNIEDLVKKFNKILEDIKKDIEDEDAAKKKELELLAKQAKELEKFIEFDEKVLPLVEEFSVNDILGDLSDDIDEVLNQISSLLDEHRVDVKDDISNKSLLKSTSGEIVGFDQNKKVQKSEKEDEPLEFNVQTGFENPFEDPIEEAILTDLIPYNFEINSIELNGKTVKELPEYNLTKEGLELKWQFNDIDPKEKIEINYDLRRRVSRTIIFIVKDDLKIIKTHSNLSPLEVQGIYDAKLPFTNPYKEMINGVVVEDIIPLYYIHLIKTPREFLPDDASESMSGHLIKWNVGNMESKTTDYHYKLLEIYKNEEIKIAINKLNNEAIEALKKGDREKAYEKFKEIRELLEYCI